MKQYKIANTLLTELAQCEHVTIGEWDECMEGYAITVDLGTGWAGDYKGGYWGDVSITDDALQFTTTVMESWDDYDEMDYVHGEGIVRLHYKDFDTAGLAYTSKLEDAIVDAVEKRTNGLLLVDGSEQGMQGMDSADDCYLSLDVGTSVDLDESADERHRAVA